MRWIHAPWPVTIFPNPCTGEIAWLALACEPAEVPPEVSTSCLVLSYWRRQRHCPPIGEGETPNAALANLMATLSRRAAS